MRVYLFDASALVAYFLRNPAEDLTPVKRRLTKLISSWRPKEGPVFFIPNFGMGECSKAFANIFLRGRGRNERARAEYRQHVDALMKMVSSRINKNHLIHTYKLKRDHLVDIEDVFLLDHATPLRDNEDPLSAFDALMLTMARDLQKAWEKKGEVLILTAEKRMAGISIASHGQFPRAINLRREEIPGT